MMLKDHIHGCTLGPLAVGSIHLAEIPLDSEQDVTTHYEAIGVFLVIGGDSVG